MFADANVCVQLYGDKGKSDTLHLDSAKNNFERGSEDKVEPLRRPLFTPHPLLVFCCVC